MHCPFLALPPWLFGFLSSNDNTWAVSDQAKFLNDVHNSYGLFIALSTVHPTYWRRVALTLVEQDSPRTVSQLHSGVRGLPLPLPCKNPQKSIRSFDPSEERTSTGLARLLTHSSKGRCFSEINGRLARSPQSISVLGSTITLFCQDAIILRFVSPLSAWIDDQCGLCSSPLGRRSIRFLIHLYFFELRLPAWRCRAEYDHVYAAGFLHPNCRLDSDHVPLVV